METNQITTNQIDQYDLVAEDAVIGILLYAPELITEVPYLSPDSFSEYRRSKAYEVIQSQPDDNILITLGDHFESSEIRGLIDLFMDVTNRDVHENELLTYAERVRTAKDLRLAGSEWTKPLDTDFMARYAAVKDGSISLASELWFDSIMVAPAVSHFSGEYPAEPEDKTCNTYWSMDVYKSEQGHEVKARGARYSVLHSYIGKHGLMGACPHCLHKRAVELSKHIERASETYTNQNLMRQATVSETKAGRIAATVKKRNQRDKEGITYSIVKVPQNNSQVWILHDVPDLEGEPLPHDRGSLYRMILNTVKKTPKGRRGWRGLAGWGQADKEQPAKSEPIGSLAEGAKQKAKKDDPKFVARIMGENWGKFSTLLQGFLGEDTPITKKGITFEVDLDALLLFLDESGLNYAVIDGELPSVPLKAYKTKPICAKRDKPPKEPEQQQLWEDPITF